MKKPLNLAKLIRQIYNRKAIMSFPGVAYPMRIILDDRHARHEYFTTAIYPFESLLTHNNPKLRQELSDIYISSVNTCLISIREDFTEYHTEILTNLDHTQTLFAQEIMANPMILSCVEQATISLATYIYFKLREFGFLSDENVYILDTLGPDFYCLSLYPERERGILNSV